MSTSSQKPEPFTPDREQEIRDRVDAAVDAEFVAHAREDVPQLLAEVDRLRLLVRMYREHADHYRAYEQDARAEIDRLRARVAELERPAVWNPERKRWAVAGYDDEGGAR